MHTWPKDPNHAAINKQPNILGQPRGNDHGLCHRCSELLQTSQVLGVCGSISYLRRTVTYCCQTIACRVPKFLVPPNKKSLRCVPAGHLRQSRGPPGRKPRKSLQKVFPGLPARSLKKVPKRSKSPSNDTFRRLFGDFSTFSGLF